MLIPVKVRFPTRLLVSPPTKNFTIEQLLPVKPLMFPKYFAKNIESAASARVIIKQVIDFGISEDPLNAGTFETVLTDQIVGPGELLTYAFDTDALADGFVYHIVQLTNLGIGECILQQWVEGVYEEALRQVPPTPPIVI